MKICSWNVNGIRACIQKGFWEWFDKENADVVCLQETKITEADFLKLAHAHELTPILPPSGELPFEEPKSNKRKHPIYFAIAAAKRPGYSGVAILSKTKPSSINIGLGNSEYDDEGRTIIADFEKFIVINTYVPNGGRELERIPYKIKYSDFLLKKLQLLRKKQKKLIICGDFNVAHTEIDIKNAKSNEKNSGFTPIEREWFTKFLNHKYVDSFREMHPNKKDIYTWWSYRPGVRQRNIGWRIDYFVVTPEMMKNVNKSDVQMEQMGSDHCPIRLIF